MKTQPIWQEKQVTHFAKAHKNAHFDVAIVGGGITGLSAAYLLKQAGKRVCVLERDRIGSGDTGYTTAHLTHVCDLRLSSLVKHFGAEAAKLAWQAGVQAIRTIEAIAIREQIDCEFARVPGFLHASLDSEKDETADLEKEAALANQLGFAAEFLDSVPYLQKPGIRFPNQARFHPLKYLAGLAQAVEGGGCQVFEESEVDEFEAEPMRIKANRHWIDTDYLVIATHVPLMGITGLISATALQTKLYPHSSYVLGGRVAKGSLPQANFWDTSEPYYYLRLQEHADYDYAIFGGLDHKTGQVADTEEIYERLAAKFRDVVPGVKIDHRWSGQVVETNDGLPFIGETAERQFAATGFAGNGMTFGTIGGLMACDAALQRDNAWQDLFSIDRKKIRGGTFEFLRENIDYPYYLLKDHLTPSEGDSPDDVKAGEGKIIKYDGQRVACSRNEAGTVTMVSAVCPHMGCLVHWNGAESTWDCPCHGSRFKADGKVIGGPAETPLEPVEEKPKKPKRAARPRAGARRKGREPGKRQSH